MDFMEFMIKRLFDNSFCILSSASTILWRLFNHLKAVLYMQQFS